MKHEKAEGSKSKSPAWGSVKKEKRKKERALSRKGAQNFEKGNKCINSAKPRGRAQVKKEGKLKKPPNFGGVKKKLAWEKARGTTSLQCRHGKETKFWGGGKRKNAGRGGGGAT